MDNQHPNPRQAVIIRAAAACLFLMLGSAPALAAADLSAAEVHTGKARAEAELVADRAARDKLSGTPRAVCREQARGKERVAWAELHLGRQRTRQSQDSLATLRMDAAYGIARTQGHDKAGKR